MGYLYFGFRSFSVGFLGGFNWIFFILFCFSVGFLGRLYYFVVKDTCYLLLTGSVMGCSETLPEKASETGCLSCRKACKNHLWVLTAFPGKRLIKGKLFPVEFSEQTSGF